MSGSAKAAAPPGNVAGPDLPLWLARLHRRLPVETMTTVTLEPVHTDGLGLPIVELLDGAGFSLLDQAPSPSDRTGEGGRGGRDERRGQGDRGGRIDVRLRRLHTLPDWVGPEMKALIVGLNPSPASADGGVNFARPGNRFWPAAMAAGLVDADRDPEHALVASGVGFTDLVKRTTRTAAELDAAEFGDGLRRVTRLAAWLEPGVVVVVGLTGWRAAVNRRAIAGWQTERLGPSPVYLMPNTSGLNAHSSLDDFTAHFRAAVLEPAQPAPVRPAPTDQSERHGR